jgi:hypothetical protein
MPVAPKVSITIAQIDALNAQEGPWRVTWNLTNESDDMLRLEDAWIPHGRFRGDGRLRLATSIAPGASVPLTFTVTAREDPATVVENTFLILRADLNGQAWRMFCRMRVTFDGEGIPRPQIEQVTWQSLE